MMYAKLQTHTNIVESRKAAIQRLTKLAGMAYYLNGEKIPKIRLVKAIRDGYLDGFAYRADYSGRRSDVEYSSSSNFFHYIGH